ncbi:hypothetical protein VNO80_04700 [Phaseolus coccineus]|uniref:Uncharacterized protein n=1 Tax=Phaseolus coccineus TaxID=3886 RepID=A0AAN9NTW3_PHACN
MCGPNSDSRMLHPFRCALPANTFSDYRTPIQSLIPQNLPWNSTESKSSFVLDEVGSDHTAMVHVHSSFEANSVGDFYGQGVGSDTIIIEDEI